MNENEKLRKLIIDWLDDNYHFGDAENLIAGDDEKSFLQSGILDSLGFVSLVLFLENSCNVTIDRGKLSPANFDSLGKIVRFVVPLPDYKIDAEALGLVYD
ncbi:MAG: acyl carrier protein [Pseudomonadota bacterium]